MRDTVWGLFVGDWKPMCYMEVRGYRIIGIVQFNLATDIHRALTMF